MFEIALNDELEIFALQTAPSIFGTLYSQARVLNDRACDFPFCFFIFI